MACIPFTKCESSGPVRPWPLGLGAIAVPASCPVDGFEAVAVISAFDGAELPLSEGAALDEMVGDALEDILSELAAACES